MPGEVFRCLDHSLDLPPLPQPIERAIGDAVFIHQIRTSVLEPRNDGERRQIWFEVGQHPINPGDKPVVIELEDWETPS